MRPLVGVLTARNGLAPGALWRLAGDAMAGRLLDMGEKLGRLEEAKAAALLILKQPGSPECNRFPTSRSSRWTAAKRPRSRAASETIIAQYKRIDVLVNSAGVTLLAAAASPNYAASALRAREEEGESARRTFGLS